MSELTIFKDAAQLPAHFCDDDFGVTKNLSSGTSNMPPMIKINSKTFELVQNGETTQLGISFKAIIIGSGPIAKKYFITKYTGKEDDSVRPDCASSNGVIPDKAITKPACLSCAVCPNNAFGSKINELGNQTKACTDYRRLVVYLPNKNKGANKFFRLDLPTMSIKPAAQYANLLAMRGVPVHGVLTQLSFDSDLKYPKLVFDAVQVLTKEQFETIKQEQKDQEVDRIIYMETISLESEHKKEHTEPEPQKVTAKKASKAVSEVDATTLEFEPKKESTPVENFAAEVADMLKAME